MPPAVAPACLSVPQTFTKRAYHSCHDAKAFGIRRADAWTHGTICVLADAGLGALESYQP